MTDRTFSGTPDLKGSCACTIHIHVTHNIHRITEEIESTIQITDNNRTDLRSNGMMLNMGNPDESLNKFVCKYYSTQSDFTLN